MGSSHESTTPSRRGFEKLRTAYSDLLQACFDYRKLFASAFSASASRAWLLVGRLGQDFFPTVDAGQIRLHRTGEDGNAHRGDGTSDQRSRGRHRQRHSAVRTRAASWTTSVCRQAESICPIATAKPLATSMRRYWYRSSRSITRPPDTSKGFVKSCRKSFPATGFFFEPADIVTQILEFRRTSTNRYSDRRQRTCPTTLHWRPKWYSRSARSRAPSTSMLHQLLNQPRLDFAVDRVRTQQVGLSERDVASNVLCP